MKHDEHEGLCRSVARACAVIRERWTMMILRKCFRGERRYEHFRSKLGLGGNVLNDRQRAPLRHARPRLGAAADLRHQRRPEAGAAHAPQ
ncbi:winged helix-turn-helix transcriptional regulator [Pseudonocardia yuanmonensis]|uniref:winged helix-turn-helix transcriptional regulator n=1 Tax=Pseudonocardia yuanmonensis TaxID=1095914 RepID=UPI0031ECFD7C